MKVFLHKILFIPGYKPFVDRIIIGFCNHKNGKPSKKWLIHQPKVRCKPFWDDFSVFLFNLPTI